MTFYLTTGALGFIASILAIAYCQMRDSRQRWRRRAAVYLSRSLFWEDAWLRDVPGLLEELKTKEKEPRRTRRAQRN